MLQSAIANEEDKMKNVQASHPTLSDRCLFVVNMLAWTLQGMLVVVVTFGLVLSLVYDQPILFEPWVIMFSMLGASICAFDLGRWYQRRQSKNKA